MSNNSQKLTVPPEVMGKAVAVGPVALLKSVQLANVNAMLGGDEDTSPKYVRHRRTHSFKRTSEHEVVVTLRFALEIATKDEEKDEPPIAIEGRYLLTYQIDGLASFDDEHLDAFAQVNGYFNGWPFWRELTSSLLARMKCGLFLLPSLKVESPPVDAAN